MENTYYCEKCGRILFIYDENKKCENCGNIMIPVPKYWLSTKDILFNETDKKEFIDSVIKTNPNFDLREYNRTQKFLELKDRNSNFSAIKVPKTMPKKPRPSIIFIVYSILIFGIMTYFFLIFPSEIYEEPDIKGWILEIALFLGIPALIYFSNYKKALEYYKIASDNFEDYKDKYFEDEVERQKLKLQGKVERTPYSIHCPVCNSTNVKRISTASRAVSVGTVGLASSKIGKQYECKSCHHKW